MRLPPSALVEERASWEPEGEDAWGARGLRGWQPHTTRRKDGSAYVWSRSTVCVLEIDAGEPRDRRLGMRAWSRREGEHLLDVRLNGEALGSVALTRSPAEVSIDAPEDAWRRGANLLELTIPEDAGALALGSVSTGSEDARVERGADAWTLDPSAGVSWLLEPRGSGSLEVALRDEPGASLRLAFHAVDAVDGRRRETLTTLELRPPAPGEELVELPLPDPGGALLEVELSVPTGATRTTLTALRVERIARAPRPSIVLVSLDTLAARHLSLYGYERETSPELDRFAAEAVTFERCHTNAPWTLPSHMALLTGVHALAHQTRARGQTDVLKAWEQFSIAPSRWTLAEMLGASGYRTAAFVDNSWLSPKAKFDQGFEVFDTRAVRVPNGVPGGGIETVMEGALAWLDALEGDAPFFLFLHSFDVHSPYWPEEPYAGSFREASEIGEAWPLTEVNNLYRHVPRTFLFESPEEAPERLSLERLRAAYDEGILELDAAMGRLFDALRERGAFEESLIVITADHGESLGSHHWVGHGTLYEEVLSVPLIVRLPGGEGGGRRVAGRVQLLDLFPTIQALLGIEREGAYLNGRSLLPALRGEPLEERATLAESGVLRQSAVEYEGWKLIEQSPQVDAVLGTMLTHPALPEAWRRERLADWEGRIADSAALDAWREAGGAELERALAEALQGPHYELYYLPDDPTETNDRSATDPDKLREMQGLLDWLRDQRKEARLHASLSAPALEFSPEEIAELRKLGYLESE